MKRLSALFIFLFSFCTVQFAQSEMQGTGFSNDILAEIEFVQGRILQLAEAFPEEKFSWRPAEGVRSVSEVFMHLGGANYFIPTFFGGTMPEGADGSQDYEKKTTAKAEVIGFLKGSFDNVKSIVSKVKDEDLEKPVEFFGNKSNERRMVIVALYHMHEHLGQAIAYARMNGVVPPWSMAEGQ